jgi:hypothetical protein
MRGHTPERAGLNLEGGRVSLSQPLTTGAPDLDLEILKGTDPSPTRDFSQKTPQG